MEQKETTAVVALADALAGRFVSRKEGDSIWSGNFDALLKKYSVTDEDLSKVGDKLVQATPDIEKVFSAH
ncbi:hypothetical protein SBDP1_180006 [Syntrophobacter sp. SbD1]|nr:hypothetical protein SBDP1_180006 [Syntrophobacter sp. SbD1]